MRLSLVFKFVILIFFIGCKNHDKKINKESYDIIVGYKRDTVNKIIGDYLEIFFETEFNNDLLKVKINNKEKEYRITTDGSTGYADYIELGKLSTIDLIEFSINNGKLIQLEDVETNLILVNYVKDSAVWIDFTNKFKSYK